MKKPYVKPELEIEQFQLYENVAACEIRVHFGPDDDTSACPDYGFPDDLFTKSAPQKRSAGTFQPFYEGGCECYYSAPRNSGYFSS